MRWSSASELLPAALDAIVEGSWLAIAYLALQVLGAHGPILIGPLEFSLLAGAGLLLARGRTRWTGRSAVAVAAVVAALAGWTVAPDVRQALFAGQVDTALGFHTGGWLAGVAVVRGGMHAERSEDDLIVSRLLSWALPGLALPWLLAQVASPAARAVFSDPAFVATMTFVVTALLALAIARLDTLGAGAGVDWRHNPAWLLVLVTIVAGAVVVGLPLAAVLGVPLDAAIRGAAGPVWLVVIGAIAVLAIPAGLLAAGLVVLLRAILGPAHLSSQTSAAGGNPIHPPPTAPGAGPVFAIIVVALLLLGLALLAWRLLPSRDRRGSADEERGIVLPQGGIRPSIGLPRWRPRPSTPPPHDAVTAYVATIGELRADPDRARAADETPAAHARRLRTAGRGLLGLDLLAADYALVRYAGRTLTRAEDRRGLARWKRTRTLAGAAAPPAPGPGHESPAGPTISG